MKPTLFLTIFFNFSSICFGQIVETAYLDLPFDSTWTIKDTASLNIDIHRTFLTLGSDCNSIEINTTHKDYASVNLVGIRRTNQEYFLPLMMPNLIPFPQKEDNKYSLVVRNVALDLDDHIYFKFYTNYQNMKAKKVNKGFSRLINKESEKNEAVYEETIFSNFLNEVLQDKNYLDSSLNFLDVDQSLLRVLNVSIRKLSISTARRRGYNRNGVYVAKSSDGVESIESDIIISLCDVYGDTLISKAINSVSHEFLIKDYKMHEEVRIKAITQSLEQGLAKFLQFSEVRKELEMTQKSLSAALKADFTGVISKVSKSQLAKSIVGISGNDVEQTGFLISKDGLVVTSYIHSLNKEDLQYKFESGLSGKLEYIKSSKEYGLSLFKIEGQEIGVALSIFREGHSDILDDVTVYSVTDLKKDIFGFSSGIISGKRQVSKYKYFWQTDTPLAYPSLGAPAINQNGELIGIVSKKMTNDDLQGISFILPTSLLIKAFSLTNSQ